MTDCAYEWGRLVVQRQDLIRRLENVVDFPGSHIARDEARETLERIKQDIKREEKSE